ncbi:hypothetical protein H206_05417 [Candidatus Electrothrix aarhusensis]|uniref:Uncharacterized protein n=1 Tax=Candidatus Electrothrix aarhusensis TaxID=1859131 RepID=A0A444J4J0_9BACT|nr:hypothetical protein H206_05417 [Candidatus Electrothrix aarhusensis]
MVAGLDRRSTPGQYISSIQSSLGSKISKKDSTRLPLSNPFPIMTGNIKCIIQRRTGNRRACKLSRLFI